MKNKLVNPKSIVLVSIFICFHLISNVTSSLSFDELSLDENNGITYLKDSPLALQSSRRCGNGIIEPDEECDCGRPDCGRCCDGKTCVLNSTACCGSGPCCNPKTCFPYARIDNVVCRKAVDECDLPEYCNGLSEFCPENHYKPDGIPCNKSPFNARCYRGHCANHAIQCGKLWGPNIVQSHETCYKAKLMGKTTFPCGLEGPINRTQRQCTIDDTTCGLLYCNAPADTKLVFAQPFAGSKKHNIINGTHQCLALEGSLSSLNPGMVPDGSPCGTTISGICIGVKCVLVDTVLKNIKACPKNCSGHGICNNVGKCHCDPLYTNSDCSVEISKNMSKPMNNSTASLIFKPTPKQITECREKLQIFTTSASSQPINLSTFTLAIIIGFLLSVLVSVAVLWNLYHRYGSSNTEDNRPGTAPKPPATPVTPATPATPAIPPN